MSELRTPLDLGVVPARGRLAVEASAGTGKTWSLATLATAYLADGVAASELLAVTFTRAATAELRDRIRSRIADVAHHLDLRRPADGPDPLLERLLAEPDEPAERLHRALRELDAATITTIHGFATQVLTTLGATAGTDLDARLVDQGDELVLEVCADVLAMASTSGVPVAHLPTFAALVKGTHAARSEADLLVEPREHQPEAEPADVVLAGLVRQSVDALRARRRAAGTLSFDDVLVELRTALRGGGRRAVVDALQRRFRVALIDEFQDTDPVQWEVFRTVFGDAAERGEGALVLVGDPKQAIYAFRGANVHTYLEAIGDGSTAQASLDRSWRSDGALLRALDAVFAGATFGDEQIRFTSVDAAPGNEHRRLAGPDGAPAVPLRIRLVLDPDLRRNKDGSIAAPAAAQACFQDLVTQVRALLDGGRVPSPDGSDRPVRPADVGVLVRSNADAEAAQQALVAQGVPAVLARSGSVLDSEAAMHWRWLLEAMARPSDPRRARAYALSWFVGWTAEEVDAADDRRLAELQERLQRWVELLLSRGATRFVRAVWADTGVQARVLARTGGDRAATDLTHVAEILQAPSSTQGVSVTSLLSRLETPPVEDPEADKRTELAARRVETESSAVQVMTVWVAKGLEFPIVCCPTLWRTGGAAPARYQDEETGRRALDLSKGKGWPSKAEAKARATQIQLEEQGEQLRLLYVALTRARHQTLLWWSPTYGGGGSALARLLFGRDAAGRCGPPEVRAVALPEAEQTAEALQPLVEAAGATISVEQVPGAAGASGRWVDPEAPATPPSTSVAVLGTLPDRRRRRWSFTTITSEVETTHFDPLDDSLADRGTTDEGHEGPEHVDEDELDVPDDDAVEVEPGDVPEPIATPAGPFDLLPASAAIGSLVHHVFERVDVAADPLEPALSDGLGAVLSWFPLDLTPVMPGATAAEGRELLVTAMADAVRTPFGGDLGTLALCDLAPEDRLVELAFELVLGEEGQAATDQDLGEALLHHLPDDDPVRPWAHGLARGAFGVDLAGHLTGAIDLIFRVPGPDGALRFVVADYKTNRLHPYGEPARAEDYAPAALAAAMASHHYPLQALLYSVALHRYLRWRLPDYDPEVHLGGIAYFFLRGMTGPDVARTPDGASHGVFRWTPPAALISDLSDLLAGRARKVV